MASMIVTFLINFVLSGALGLMVGLVNSLQLIVHLPMMRVPFPPNAMSFMRYILPTVMFDILGYKD
jgi:hypothetical protein